MKQLLGLAHRNILDKISDGGATYSVSARASTIRNSFPQTDDLQWRAPLPERESPALYHPGTDKLAKGPRRYRLSSGIDDEPNHQSLQRRQDGQVGQWNRLQTDDTTDRRKGL